MTDREFDIAVDKMIAESKKETELLWQGIIDKAVLLATELIKKHKLNNQ